MKSLLSLFIATIFLALNTHAQDSPELPKVPKIPGAGSKEDAAILEINLDNWTEAPDGIKIKTFRSRGIAIKYFSEKNLGKSSFHFAYGLGLNSNNVHHDGFLAYDSSRVAKILPLNPAVDYKINKISLTYINIPLELRYRTKPLHKSNRIKVSGGFMGGLLINSHVKFKDDDGTFKAKKIEGILPYQYGVTARIGYGKYNVSGYYGLSNVFEDGKGPELTPYSIGISIIPY